MGLAAFWPLVSTNSTTVARRQAVDLKMRTSPSDDARERAEMAFALAEKKYGEGWRRWPDMNWFDKDDVAPWWCAGLEFIHEILPAEADASAPQQTSRIHLETHLYSWLEAEAEQLFVDKLQSYHDRPLWEPGAALPAFRRFAVRESRALIDSLVNKNASVQQPAPNASTCDDRKRMRQAANARVGRNIGRLRSERGWSFDGLADASGVDRKLLMRCESGGGGLQPSTKKKIADAFRISVAELEK